MSEPERKGVRSLHRNVWATSLTSFFTDISSEMVLNVVPLFLANVLGVRTTFIGLIEGVAEATASLLKIFSGWISDRFQKRKWLAVLGYGISAATKPFFYIAASWTAVGAVRFADRIGKGIRNAPRDALIADSIAAEQRGLAFGFHRAADSAGAVIGIGIAAVAVWWIGGDVSQLGENTFRTIVLLSILPAFLAVASLAIGARDIPPAVSHAERPRFGLFSLGRRFAIFIGIVGLFDLGNSSDAFLILRAQERGISVTGILLMLITFNLIYTLVATPAGSLSDRIDRKTVIVSGWLIYSGIYLGFALSQQAWHIWVLYGFYGVYYGLAFGTARAMVADLVPAHARGMAFGTYNAVLGILDLPASVIAGVLWQGIGSWQGFGPSAPFFFGAGVAFLAAVLLFLWKPLPDDRQQ